MTSWKEHHRPEIQGLRALAVLAVVLFHLWPALVPGGYVGVDVFFVISGYLMTGQLLRELEATGTVSPRRFLERRILRLLPAATVVLLAVLATIEFLPEFRWRDVSIELLASATFVENWRLAERATSYFGAEQVASPVRHFWSLSVEEQFYLLWPTVFLGCNVLGRKTGLNRRWLTGVVVGAVSVASLAVAVTMTGVAQSSAYFLFRTRAWELGVGALIALAAPGAPAPVGSERAKSILAATGLAGIALASAALSSRTHAPGYATLLPMVATALVILSAGGVGPTRWILCNRPILVLGDLSYSLYLWHWPPIVYFGSVVHRAPDALEGAGLLLLMGGFSYISKVLIEDRVRYRSTRAARHPFVLLSSCVAASAVGAILLFGRVERAATFATEATEIEYPGALARTDGVSVPPAAAPIPPAAHVKRDLPVIYATGCHVLPPGEAPKVPPELCDFGDLSSSFRVLLIGDSHAAQWMPALERLSLARHWRLTTLTKSACPLLTRPTLRKENPYPQCTLWRQAVFREVAQVQPQLIFTTQSSHTALAGAGDSMVDALRETWSRLAPSTQQIFVIRDTPRFSFSPMDLAVANAPSPEVVSADDPLIPATVGEPKVTLLDLTSAFCTGRECPPVIGNVVVYRDRHHLTATFSRTLAKPLDRLIRHSTRDLERLGPLPHAISLVIPSAADEARSDGPVNWLLGDDFEP